MRVSAVGRALAKVRAGKYEVEGVEVDLVAISLPIEAVQICYPSQLMVDYTSAMRHSDTLRWCLPEPPDMTKSFSGVRGRQPRTQRRFLESLFRRVRLPSLPISTISYLNSISRKLRAIPFCAFEGKIPRARVMVHASFSSISADALLQADVELRADSARNDICGKDASYGG